MRRFLILLSVFSTLECLDLYSQAPPAPVLATIVKPSPNVQAIQKYGDIPVSPYTGIPDISIPLYTANFRDISIPVSLSYHASGIKVAEDASEVGLGWVLNAAGTISRNIIGADDFNGSVYFNGSSDTVMDFAAGQGPTHIIQTGCNLQMFNRSIPNLPTIYNYDITAAILSNPQIDFEPDQYYYNYPGHSGKFLMTRKMQAVLQKQEAIQISCLSTTGSSWRIKSQDGYIYDFTLSETYLDPVVGGTHISSWYLTKITSPLGNTATFNYSQINNYIQTVGSYTESRDDWDQPMFMGFPTASNGSSKGATAGKQYTSQVLSSIDLSNCHIKFYYSNNRPDLLGDQRLDSLGIFEKDRFGNTSATPVKTISLGYGYFNYGDVDDDFGAGATFDYERLKLTQVQETGYYGGITIKNNPYLFTYFENSAGYNMPSKASFARDHWGYYNGKLPNTSLIPSVQPVSTIDPVVSALGLPGTERNTDSNYVKAFTLQAIQYPTGGSTEFQYEANDFDEQNSEVLDGSFFASQSDVVNASQIFLYDAVAKTLSGTDTLDLTQEYMFTSGGLPSYGIVSINAAFRFSSASQCNTPPAPLNVIYFDLYDSTGTQVLLHSDLAGFPQCTGTQTQACYSCGSGVFTVNQTMTLLPGKYIIKPVCLNSGYGTLLQNIKVTYTFYEKITSQPTYYTPGGPYFAEGGGLRIKRIIDHDNVSSANDQVKRYVYHYWADKAGTGTPQEYSYGRRMSKPEYSYFTIDIDDDATQGISCHDEVYYSVHLMRTSDSDNPLNGSAGGAVVGYDQVTELFGENGEAGQKTYKYTNLPDAVDDYAEPFTGLHLPQRPPYSANLQNALNGSLVEQTDYAYVAGNFIKIKDILNQYTTEHASENDVYGLENRKMQSNSLGDRCNVVLTENCDVGSLTIPYISMNSEWMHIVNSDEKTYNQNDTTKYYETLTNYYYDDPGHFLPTRISVNDSKGQLITTTTHYPLDFPNLTATDPFTLGVLNLQNSHVINAPIEKFVQVSDSNGNNIRTTDAVINSYNTNAPLPNLVYKAELPYPSSSFVPAANTVSGISKDVSYQPKIVFDSYDTHGNILQQNKVNDINYSYIWDYDSTYPVAEIVNAVSSDVAFTSFEFDGGGNWTVPSTLRDSLNAITGINSYNLTHGNISKTGLTNGKIYLITYWSRNGSYSITGGTGSVRTGRSIPSGWTYYEHTITASSSTVSISGSGDIDELRLYPQGSQVTSYTFAPLIGMTTKDDPNGEITYYEYDGLARLRNVKDYQGNIIKNYQYNYVSINSCGTNCQIISLQTFAGTIPISYPVGVFNINGKLLGNVTNQAQYITTWMSDTADSHTGTIVAGTDSMHFSFTVNAGRTTPGALTGCRYYQYDLHYNKIDAIRNSNGVYVDYGDGTGMRLGITTDDSNVVRAPNTIVNVQTGSSGIHFIYWIHSYPDTSMKTITFYHNDASENMALDNAFAPATSLTLIRNLRGNLPQNTTFLDGDCTQQSSVFSLSGITNWNTINTVTSWGLFTGDEINPCLNISYPQDFMANNKNLQSIITNNRGYYLEGYEDTTFKISRLKSNWNTYFTNLTTLDINDDHWNREDLTALTNLSGVAIDAGNLHHSYSQTNNPLVPIPTTVIDNIINQISTGAGHYISNGSLNIPSGGGSRSSASDAAVSFLKTQGWTVTVNGTNQ